MLLGFVGDFGWFSGYFRVFSMFMLGFGFRVLMFDFEFWVPKRGFGLGLFGLMGWGFCLDRLGWGVLGVDLCVF